MNATARQVLDNECFAHIADMNDALERIEEICKRHNLAELSLFGSVSRGTATAASDIDLLYRFADNARPGFGFFELERELESIFGRRVDLLAETTIPNAIRQAILAESILIYEA